MREERVIIRLLDGSLLIADIIFDDTGFTVLYSAEMDDVFTKHAKCLLEDDLGDEIAALQALKRAA